MSRISDKFKGLKKAGKKALVAYITAGDPSLSATEKLVYAIEKAGADIIELGIPFSDPLADGPVIQASHLRALKTSTADAIKLVSRIRKRSQVPLVFMAGYNLLLRFGIEKFVSDSALAGLDGIIVPDLPPEEAADLKLACKKAGVDLIFMVAPTSTPERAKEAADASSGFIYLVSVAGITGERKQVPAEAKEMVGKLKKVTGKPVVVGFGISKPEHVKELSLFADGAVVGSAIVRIIEKNIGKASLVSKVQKFAGSLAAAAHKQR